MQDFNLYVNTNIYFGKHAIENLASILKKIDKKKMLLVYGQKAIKVNGIYHDVMNQLEIIRQKFIEFSGVEENTLVSTVREAIDISKRNHIDGIIAVGGGSVIDCAKWIAAGSKSEIDIWKLANNPSLIVHTIPIVSVLTIAAAGSETDSFAVLYNQDLKMKIGIDSKALRPIATIMNPEYTYTVSQYQTACGIADIISHVIENMFSREKGEFQLNLCEAVLKTCIESGMGISANLKNYETRANLMQASSWSINGLLEAGRKIGWTIHPIEHYIGCYYGISHGEGMAILLVNWIEYLIARRETDLIDRIGRNVLHFNEENNISTEAKVVSFMKNFYKKMGLPIYLHELGITKDKFEEISEKVEPELQNTYIEMKKENILELLYLSL